MSGRVWLVEIGAYSDRYTAAVCETEEIAQAVAAALNASKKSKWSDDAETGTDTPYFAVGDPMPTKVTAWGADLYHDGRLEMRSSEEWAHDLDPRAWPAEYWDPDSHERRKLVRAMDWPTPEDAEYAARLRAAEENGE